MEQIGGILTNYMTAKEKEVSTAMGRVSEGMQDASQSVGDSSKQLHDYAAESRQKLKVSALYSSCRLNCRECRISSH